MVLTCKGLNYHAFVLPFFELHALSNSIIVVLFGSTCPTTNLCKKNARGNYTNEDCYAFNLLAAKNGNDEKNR